MKNDLYALVENFDEMTTDEENHFTKGDVDDALKIYGSQSAQKMTRKFVDRQTNIISKPQKRNGLKQKDHITRMIVLRETDYKLGIKKRPSRKNKSKEIDLMIEYMRENLNEQNKSKIARDLGINRSTVHKNYEYVKTQINNDK